MVSILILFAVRCLLVGLSMTASATAPAVSGSGRCAVAERPSRRDAPLCWGSPKSRSRSRNSAARGNAQAMATHCTAMMGQRGATGISLPDRLDQHEQFMAVQLDAMRTMNKALRPLHAALSDSQKQTANQFLWGPMGMIW